MPTLSVVMIVKNEADCLADCLDSVQAIADEIVIGDTGSTDTTREIAADYDAVILSVPWTDDFAAARNTVLAEATGDWLLHMDADEVLDPDGARRIREIVDGDGFGADAVELVLANYCDDMRAWRWVPVEPGSPWARGYAGYLAVGLLRLFRNGRGFEYREPVHENITESVSERGGRVLRENILIHHYGYTPSEERSREKRERYLALARKKSAERPEDIKAWSDLAEQALCCNETDEAERACRRALELVPYDLNAATTLANILLNRGDIEEARPLLEAIEVQGAAPAHISVALAAIDYRENRLDEARRRLDCVLEHEPKSVLARLYRARVLDRLGQRIHARRELEMARDSCPGIQELQDRHRAHRLRCQGEDFFASGYSREALDSLVAALRLDGEDPLTHNALGVVLHALGQPEKARESLKRALKLAPGLPEAAQNLEAIAGGE